MENKIKHCTSQRDRAQD